MAWDCVDRAVTFVFRWLGRFVARHPGYFIVVPVLGSILLATGLQKMVYQDDPEYLFSPIDGQASKDKELIFKLFPEDVAENFDLERLPRLGHFGRVIIIAKDEGTIFREEIFQEILRLDQIIKNFTVDIEGVDMGYAELCAHHKGKCYSNSILDLADRVSDIREKKFFIKYPLSVDEVSYQYTFYAAYLGGVQVDDLGFVDTAKAISLMYFLDDSTKKKINQANIWEDEFLQVVGNEEFQTISVARFTSRALAQELEKNTESVLPFFSVTILIMLIFSIGTCMMTDWVYSKPWLGVLGCLSSGLSVGAAFGLVVYCGMEFIGINMAAPFLMLGIGMDDTFVMLAAWRRTNVKKSVEERLGETFAEAGVSITITSITNFLSFCIGIATPFPSVRIFCTYTAMATFFTYLYHVTFFGGCMAISGFAEKRNLHAMACIPILPLSQAKDRNYFFRIFCTGGVNPDDPDNPDDNKEHLLMRFFRDTVGKTLSLIPVKILVIILFVGYVAVGIWGCSQLKEGLERSKLSRTDSYSVTYYKYEDTYFREYPYRVQVIINTPLDYSDPKVQQQIEDLMKRFEASEYMADSSLTESWLRAYLRFLKDPRTSFFLESYNMSSKSDFITGLRRVFLKFRSAEHFKDDIVFNENFTEIVACRFIAQTKDIADANEEKYMVIELRDIADSVPFKVSVFHHLFPFFDQFILVRSVSIQSISIAAILMMIISLLFIPSPMCAFWVAFSIVSIEIGVIGYMSLWKVNLDSVSMINLIMCIGFSVDYSAHISYSFITADKPTANEKMQIALYSLGMPIIQGSISTILGIVVLAFAPSYLFLVFFKTVFLVMLFAALHGVLLLPVLLSLTDVCFKKKSKEGETNGNPPFFIQAREGDITTRNGKGSVVIPRPTYNNNVIGLSYVDLENSKKNGEENSDKDAGLGTSGEESNDGSWRSREDHINPAFESDGDENGRVPRRSQSARDRRGVYRNQNHNSQRSLQEDTPGLRPCDWSSPEDRQQNNTPLSRYLDRLDSSRVRDFQNPL
ncbi:patched domain-containing protein 3-like [Centruroides sculpturatus]|uniref:patched domain-containing protein 3-like n=1 Tax=Centruroides sculpturatus TaxID=218467 RepID=UPI000C6ECDBD|nr:patched domain-containing protein 3-like [Centruroides sculpturatus]